MKLTIALLIVGCLKVSAGGFAQTVTLSERNSSLESVFKKIEKQTGYLFWYENKLLRQSGKVNIDVKNASLSEVLEKCFANQSLIYNIIDKTIVIRQKHILTSGREPEPSPPPPFIEIRGTIVSDSAAQPLEGASVKLKGTGIGTATDANGYFTLRIPDAHGVLVVSYIGYESVEVPASKSSPLRIVLKHKEGKAEDFVVVGYATQSKRTVVGSVSQIKGEEVNNRALPDLSNALAGLAPGVTVTQSTGRPGQASSTIRVRGVGSFGATVDPLVLIDGIPGTMDDVNTNDVASISVLKDASAGAIYGSRAANGVILISTRGGTKGKTRVNYNGYAGFQAATKLPDLVNSAEYATLYNEAETLNGQPATFTADQIQKYRDGSDPDNYPNSNFLKAVLSQHGLQTGHNVRVSGGSDQTVYDLSLGYVYQDGLVVKNDFSKYNVRFNITTSLNDKMKVTARIAAFNSAIHEPYSPAGQGSDLLGIIGAGVRVPATYAGKLSTGYWGTGLEQKGTPVSWLASQSFANTAALGLVGNLRYDWNIIPELKFSAIGGYTYNNSNYKQFAATQVLNPNLTISPNSLSISQTGGSYRTFQSLLEYNKRFNRHSVGLLAGYSFEDTKSSNSTASRDKLPGNDLTELNVGSADNQKNSGTSSEYALQSAFGRIKYAYDDKYLFESTMRYDGSSRFPANNKYAFFPSFAVGWRIGQENFIKDHFSWINDLKIKGSYGILGNQEIGNYSWENVLSPGYVYSFGGTVASGAARTTIVDSNLHWESTRTYDIGLEGALFNNKLSFSIDYFDKYTWDILYSPSSSVSSVLGFNVSQTNTGELSNKGWEFSVQHQNKIGRLGYTVGANFSIINNKVLSLGVGDIKQPNGMVGNGSSLFVGHPMGIYYGLVANGLYTDSADVAKGPNVTAVNGKAQPGDIKFRDISGPNGVPDGKVDNTYDRAVLGSNIPKYTFAFNFGVNYQGFDLGVLLQGVAHVNGYLTQYAGFAFAGNGTIQRWMADARWTPANPNPNAKYPRLELNPQNGPNGLNTSSYWMLNASYLRIKNIAFGYTLPDNSLKRTGIIKLRLFASVENPVTFSKYPKGWDPEINTQGNYYPILANYTFGVNVTF